MDKVKALAKEGKINENASITDEHSIIINAPLEKAWEKLIGIKKWPDWNAEISGIDGPDHLTEGVSFSWSFNGSKNKSEVQLCKAPAELAWTTYSVGAKRIYVWSLETDENQTIVTLKSSLQGTLMFVTQSHQKVYNQLIAWLEALKKELEKEA